MPSFGDGAVEATTLYLDSFGNIALNLTRDDLEQVGVVPGRGSSWTCPGQRYYAVAARTFADARPGDVILYEDSYRNMSIAISNGNAAAMLHAVIGRPLDDQDRLSPGGGIAAGALVSRGNERRRRSGSPSPTSLFRGAVTLDCASRDAPSGG